MIIPICCFTCGKHIAHKWEKYHKLISEEYKKKKIYIDIQSTNKINNINPIEKKVLDKLKLRRYCCRRMMISHIDICEKI